VSAATLPATLGSAERRAIGDFTGFVRQRFGARVRDVRLFGSRARGEGHEDSDLDILTVIDELTNAERREVWEYTGDLLTAHDVIVGGLTVSTAYWKDLQSRERLIVKEIERDGVPL
jgi:predicted nucleotidyltransferase